MIADKIGGPPSSDSYYRRNQGLPYDISRTSNSDGVFMKRTVEAAIRIGVIAGLIAWCFLIARPFLVPIVWGAIIAVAVFHGYERLRTVLGGRRITAAVLITLLMLVLLVVPSVLLGEFAGEWRAQRCGFFPERRTSHSAAAGQRCRLAAYWRAHRQSLDPAPQDLEEALRQASPLLKGFGPGSLVPLREPDLRSCSSCWRFSSLELFSPILRPRAA